jgi:predicted alpha/beta hydrolase
MEDLYFPTLDGENLHVRFYPGQGLAAHLRPSLLLVHGAIENGRVFYSESGKGLAPFLSQSGFDTYVLDFRGRGLSTPKISRYSRHGQTEMITQDLPTIIRALRDRTPFKNISPVWIAHSWGGVLLLSLLARFPEFRGDVSKIVCFGTKRSVRAQNAEKWLKVDLVWNLLSSFLARIYGYLPARLFKFGSDDETRKSHAHSKTWVQSKNWIDPEDHFNYMEEIKKVSLPPILSVVGERDFSLGHPDDVKRFFAESGAANLETLRVPFGHIDMIASAEAKEQVFPKILSWIEQGDLKRNQSS